MTTFNTWREITTFVRGQMPPGEDIRIELRTAAMHPRYVAGFVSDFGFPSGDRSDWRLPLADGSGLHARERHDGVILVHWDRVDPTCGPSCRLRHGLKDAPRQTMLIAAGIGAAIGGLRKGLVGAGVGAGVGLLAGGALLLIAGSADR